MLLISQRNLNLSKSSKTFYFKLSQAKTKIKEDK